MDNNRTTQKHYCLSLLEDCDVFGVPISIKYSGNEKHKSSIGAVATFIMFIAIFLQSYDEISILFFGQNFNLIYYENMVKSPNPFQINPKQFSLAIGLQDSQQQQIYDEGIYKLQGVYSISNRFYNQDNKNFDFTNQKEYIDLVQCTEKHFQVEDTLAYFQSLQYQKLFCLPLDYNIEIQGQTGAEVYKFLTFRVIKCNSSTSEHCKQIQEVEERLNGSILDIYLINYSIDITNNNTPFQAFPQHLFYKYGGQTKNVDIYFKNTYIQTDDGQFTSNLKEDKRLLQSLDKEQNINQISDTLFEVNISLERNKEAIYKRKHARIISTFSKLGGLFNFFYSLGILFCFPFSKIIFRQKLLNSIFSFQNKEQTYPNKLNEIYSSDPISPVKKLLANTPHTSEIDLKIYKKTSIQNTNDQNNNRKVSSNNSPFNSMNVLNNTNVNNNNLILSNNNCEEVTNLQQIKQDFCQNENLPKITQLERQRTSLKAATVINLNKVRNSIYKRKKNQFKTIVQVNDKIISSFFNTTVNSFKVKFIDILMSYFCQKRSKSQMISYGLNKLNYHLDINTIITKLLELEKLKRLLLDKDQIKLFEFIPKPIVHEEQFEVDSISGIAEHQSFAISNTGMLYEDKRSITQKAKEAEEAYHRIINQNKEADLPINRKLLQLIDPRISSQFELQTFSKNCESFATATLELNKENSKDLSKETNKEVYTPSAKSQKGLRSNFYSFNLNELKQEQFLTKF